LTITTLLPVIISGVGSRDSGPRFHFERST
jgi:hypothetical protein